MVGAPTQTPGAKPSRLTLITGDVVTTTAENGRVKSVNVFSAGDRPVAFHTSTGADGDLYVYPQDATDAVDSGLVDPELFNITQLIRDGRADVGTDAIPALVAFAGAPGATQLNKVADDLPGSRRDATLPRLGMAAVTVEKKEAAGFFRAVRSQGRERAKGVRSTEPAVSRLWYDGRVKATLDRSTAQVGAPTAWAAGFDGKGVKVAVLDSGVDANHPDLAGRVSLSRSFVPGEDIRDGFGHGTHVAATVAGSGAASGGRYKGVAPEADLMIGKVLDNSGGGDFSDVLAGMEWAAAAGADVVNMSLGTAATAARDPLTEAVDALSAATGTLFVIAAGNSGPGEVTVATPANAPSALTVGAVDRADALAPFSSRGPRVGDAGIKPEITAPGVGIVAARAAGTSLGVPVDDRYIAMNGTSMATPHVAGAAAIMAQRHPDWNGQQIKAALTSHARPISGQTVYEQGYGRLDIAAALDSDLSVTGTVDYGLVMWQDGDFDKRTQSLRLDNEGGEEVEVTLDLMVTGRAGVALPAGALTLSGSDGSDASTVAVPAGGSTALTATLDPDLVPAGRYTGTLTATTADGRRVHTPVAFIKEAPRRAVTVDFKDRLGKTPSMVELTVQGLDSTYVTGHRLRGRDSFSLRLPLGKYSIIGTLITDDPAGIETVEYATDVFALPEIDNTREPQAFHVDAARAKDLSLDVTDERRPLEASHFTVTMQRSSPGGAMTQMRGYTDVQASSDEKYGVIPSDEAKTGEFVLSTFVAVREPLQRLAVTSPVHADIAVRAPVNAARFSGTKNLGLVNVGTGGQAEIAAADVRGKAVLVTSDNLVGITEQARWASAAGAEAMIAVPPREGPRAGFVGTNLPIPVTVAGYEDGRRLVELTARGGVTIAFTGVHESRYTYSAQYYDTGALPDRAARQASTVDFVTVENTFRSDRVRRVGWEMLNAWGPYGIPSLQTGQALGQGGIRSDRILADERVWYQQLVTPYTSYAAQMVGPETVYARPGRTYRKDWYAAPMHPSAHTELACSFCRTDKGVFLTSNSGGDGDPSHGIVAGRLPTWTYYRDGEKAADLAHLLVPESAEYRVVLDTKRFGDHPGVTLGRTTRTEWSFRSEAPTTKAINGCESMEGGATLCEPLPVVLLGYALPLNLFNEAPAGRDFTFTVRTSRPRGWEGGSHLSGAKVSVSYDDGTTWNAADVRRADDDSFRVTVAHPKTSATNGYVTMRTEVWDQKGGRTVETIDRAYALR
ncbi:S8 family serine peptidase [Streptomyces wedmorensis]|uniref:S8 family serine peptidase n=1 Tax=Streptomyces wedmorensis TaxID=43759 RepID=A0ABW6J594_STRWE